MRILRYGIPCGGLLSGCQSSPTFAAGFSSRTAGDEGDPNHSAVAALAVARCRTVPPHRPLAMFEKEQSMTGTSVSVSRRTPLIANGPRARRTSDTPAFTYFTGRPVHDTPPGTSQYEGPEDGADWPAPVLAAGPTVVRVGPAPCSHLMHSGCDSRLSCVE